VLIRLVSTYSKPFPARDIPPGRSLASGALLGRRSRDLEALERSDPLYTVFDVAKISDVDVGNAGGTVSNLSVLPRASWDRVSSSGRRS